MYEPAETSVDAFPDYFVVTPVEEEVEEIEDQFVEALCAAITSFAECYRTQEIFSELCRCWRVCTLLAFCREMKLRKVNSVLNSLILKTKEEPRRKTRVFIFYRVG